MEKDRIALFALRFKLKSKFRCKTYSTKLDIYSIWVIEFIDSYPIGFTDDLEGQNYEKTLN
jgi:hypothetical protein